MRKILYKIEDFDIEDKNEIVEIYNEFYVSGHELKVCAVDIFGGIFSKNELDSMFYFAPDTLEWENLEVGYYDFFESFNDEIVNNFYESFLSNRTIDYIESLKVGEVILFYPFLFTKEFEKEEASRKRMTVQDLLLFHSNFINN